MRRFLWLLVPVAACAAFAWQRWKPVDEGWKAYEAREYSRALRHAVHRLQLNPADLDAVRLKARCSVRLTRYGESVPLFLRLDHFDAEDHVLLGKAYFETGEFHKALFHLDAALQERPGADVYRILARLYFKIDDGRRAVQFAESLSNEKGCEDEGLMMLADINNHYRRYGESAGALEKLFERQPQFAGTLAHHYRLLLVDDYVGVGNLDRASELLPRLGDIERDPKALLVRASLEHARGQYAEAERDWLRVWELEPTAGEAPWRLGDLALFQKKYKEALDWLKKAVAALPDEPKLHQDLARIYTRLGDSKSAAEHLRLAEAAAPPRK